MFTLSKLCKLPFAFLDFLSTSSRLSLVLSRLSFKPPTASVPSLMSVVIDTSIPKNANILLTADSIVLSNGTINIASLLIALAKPVPIVVTKLAAVCFIICIRPVTVSSAFAKFVIS